MPERSSRRSPARSAATAAAVSIAAGVNIAAGGTNSISPRKKSPGRPSRKTEKSPSRRAGKSPSRRADKSPSRRADKSPSRPTGRSPIKRAEKSPNRVARKPSPSRKRSPGRKPRSPIQQQIELTSSLKEEIFRYEPQVILSNHEKGYGFMKDVLRASREREGSTSSSVIVKRSTRVISSQKLEEKYEDTKGIEQLKLSEDSDVEYPEKPVKTESKPDKEFGGTLGALSGLLLFEVTFLAAFLYSSKEQYGFKDFKIPLDWKAYLDLEVAALFFGFIVLQLVLSILPVGKLVDGMPGKLERLKYRCNGFLGLLITILILGSLYYFKYRVTVVVDKFIQFYVTGIVIGHIIGLSLYLKGGRASLVAQNPFALTGNQLYDSFMGREINPTVGPFNVKMGLLKTGIIGVIVVNGAIILKSWEQTGGFSPTLLVAAGLQIWYCLDALWFEETILSTFEFMYEGMGLLTAVTYLIFPFTYCLITRFILNYKLESPIYSLIGIGIIDAVGFVIYRGSNSQKYEFRKNPLNPALAHLETIPTSRGKKLLVSGWWGWVRRPNYLGDIIMHWCFASTSGLAHPLPYLVPLFATLVLLHRAKRDDARCRQRYNTAWDRYCSRVKYHIIPKVY